MASPPETMMDVLLNPCYHVQGLQLPFPIRALGEQSYSFSSPEAAELGDAEIWLLAVTQPSSLALPPQLSLQRGRPWGQSISPASAFTDQLNASYGWRTVPGGCGYLLSALVPQVLGWLQGPESQQWGSWIHCPLCKYNQVGPSGIESLALAGGGCGQAPRHQQLTSD